MRADSPTEHVRIAPLIVVLSLTVLLTGGLVLAPDRCAATNWFDREIMDLVQRNRPEGLDNLMNTLSDQWNKANFAMASVTLAVYGDETSFRATEECLKAMMMSEAIVSPLKYATNRRRPAGTHSRGNSSFPSSHAASGFAAAASVGHFYPRARIPAYLVATLIAYSRLYNERHYPSDVIAGACIGIACARVSRAYLGWLHLDRGELASKVPFRVMVDSDGRGLVRFYIHKDI